MFQSELIARYNAQYQKSIEDPLSYWNAQAREFLTWEKPWDTTLDWNFHTGSIGWFLGGRLNVSVNCLDRHLATRANKTAIICEGNEPGHVRRLTYSELHSEVCKLASLLRHLGIKKGDRIAIYLPMISEAVVSMLACARIGAPHTVVFAGFSAAALRGRINDCTCRILITANEGVRGGKVVPLKTIADLAVTECPSIEKVLVVSRTETTVPMTPGRDLSYHEEISRLREDLSGPESVDSEDPLFILYTSGSTGKPKGVLHTTAGYLLYAAVTHKQVFGLREDDVYFCTADIGWVTGHSYVVYGPLCNGATTILFESLPVYPDAGRYWDTVSRHRATIFYTAPTAIRTLAKEADTYVKKYDLSSLRVLGTVGEPINPDAWQWYHDVVGGGRCPVVDTWWQTETGGILISAVAGVTPTRPGSASFPLFGVQPCIVDDGGTELVGNEVAGKLCLKFPWPGIMRTVYGDHQRFIDTYFKTFPGLYMTGDGARRDEEGFYWITGRIDDVLNVAGHRLGTAEVESAIVHSGIVAEAAVVGAPHEIKGQGICAFCVLRPSVIQSAETRAEIVKSVRDMISPIAAPDWIWFVSGLPKTRSGKIMRRILRKIAEGEFSAIGDTSTLADPSIVDEIVRVVSEK